MTFLKKHGLLVGIVLSSALITGCEKKESSANVEQKKTANDTPAQPAAPAFNASIQSMQIQLPACSGRGCPEFLVKQLQSNQKFIDLAIQKATLAILRQNIALTLIAQGEMPAASDVVAQDATFNAQIQQYANEFSHAVDELKKFSANTEITFQIEPQVIQSKKGLVTIKLVSYSYLGGAHGASTQQYFIFDLNQKRQIELDHVIEKGQRKIFDQLAHEQFSAWVKAEGLAENVDQYEQSWEFSTAHNFYFSKAGLVLQYGEYEIGPYAAGMPTLTIPYNKLKGVIQPQYLP